MIYRRSLLLMVVMSACFSLRGQTFPCDGRFFISLYTSGPPTSAYWIELEESGTVNFNDLAVYPSIYFNATGYNRQDSYLYGTRGGSNHVIRIFADGTFEVAGSIPGIINVNTGAGDCTPEGIYVYHERQLNQLLFFEVADDFALLQQLDLYWDPASGYSGIFNLHLDDIAFDPLDPGTAYTYLRNYPGPFNGPPALLGHLLRLDVDLNSPTAGQVSVVGYVSEEVVRHIGALFFDANGNLFGYGSQAGGSSVYQNRLIALDKNTGGATLLGTGPGASGNDGCSCPYTIVFEKDVARRQVACFESNITYELRLTNRFHETLPGLSLRDTLPPGLLITGLEGSIPGSVIASGTGVGTDRLIINEINLPVGETFTLTVTAGGDPQAGYWSNQAFLHHVPDLLGAVIPSDDPATLAIFRDPTVVTVVEPQPADFEVSTQSPAVDCSGPATGSLTISSPFLAPGQTYTVSFQHNNAPAMTVSLIANPESTLELAGLPPGIYSGLTIGQSATDCHITLPESVTITPPAPVPGASIMNNGPLCFGNPVQLTALAPDGSTYAWSGPAGFSDTHPAPLIPNGSAANAGAYQVLIRYGSCESLLSTDVIIEQSLQAWVTGDTLFCEGDTLRLLAGGGAFFAWNGPGGLTTGQPEMTIMNTEPALHSGLYEVFVANDYGCDTILPVGVVVLERPSVELEAVTPLCPGETLALTSNAATGYLYRWTGPDGFQSNEPAPVVERVSRDASGTYRLTLRQPDLLSCQRTDSVTVTIHEGVFIEVDGPRLACAGETIEWVSRGDFSFQWAGPDTLVANGPVLRWDPVRPGDLGWYTLTVSNENCSATDSLRLEARPTPRIDLAAEVRSKFCEPQLMPVDYYPTPGLEFEWSPATGLSCQDCPQPLLTPPLAPVYTLRVSNPGGCTLVDSIAVSINLENGLYVPNAFSPNDDTVNDYFQLYPGCVVESVRQFKVFDRWGRLVFTAEDFDPHLETPRWDGRFQGHPEPSGVFTWLAEVVYLSGETALLSGNVQLLR